ncbi:MAG: sugar nucleotide-binding protein, partial [Candidatus Kapaibacterium sp.]
PTLTDDVAYAILKIIEKNLSGIVNIAGENRVSRWEWANSICDVYRIDRREMLVPVESIELQREALRPLQSGFVTTKMASMLEFKAIDVEHGLYLLRIQKERGTT